ncbi:membrane transporter [Pholiota conissans]|uniref:Membrane transporter n=1 Tax=Pholiota conissans TaxID=109636 RepID=A0A9P6D5C2_9AGAR|nr:membrane transporter [Pholiota conissans]
MASSSILAPTVIDYTNHAHLGDLVRSTSKELSPASELVSKVGGIVSSTTETFVRRVDSYVEDETPIVNPEFKLPSWRSLFVVIGGNALFQLSFFVIVSSASVYAELLGGTATFAGLTIGIPTLFSGICLVFITRLDKGQYAGPFNIAYAAAFLGNVIYALAYRANWLYLILIGRMVSGFGFISFLYSKRYCSDPRIVGIRRRTTLASWLVIGQAFGFSAGPFFGGVLYKIGLKNRIFNGVTSPGWIMAVVWIIFWGLSIVMFQDVSPRHDPEPVELTMSNTLNQSSPAPTDVRSHHRYISPRQWGVIVCMCYYAMTCFFILGSWEANIPVFTAEALGYSPYNAGNFIALGGVCSFPFLLLNVWYARRVQDRVILAIGSTLGLVGLLIMLAILLADRVTFGSFFVCWFLIALGFNLASTCTLSLLSKQLPDTWNSKISMAIQYSNYTGRVTGAILGGAGVKIGMVNYTIIQIAIVGLGGLMYTTLWKQMKAKAG